MARAFVPKSLQSTKPYSLFTGSVNAFGLTDPDAAANRWLRRLLRTVNWLAAARAGFLLTISCRRNHFGELEKPS